jgi:hypothetical protein
VGLGSCAGDSLKGRDSMEDYRILFGEESQRLGPFRVECPCCGVQAGMLCRNPDKTISDGAHKERRDLLVERVPYSSRKVGEWLYSENQLRDPE